MSLPDISAKSKFQSVLSVVKRAKTDNEKFAAMLVISKSIKPESLPEAHLRELLVNVGLQFPLRLLQTASSQVEDEENALLYGVISASVISLFCMDAKLCADWKLVGTVPTLLKTISLFSKYDDKQSARDIVKDCIESLTFLVHHDLEGVDHENILKTLVTLRDLFGEKVSSLILQLVEKNPSILRSHEYNIWIQNLSCAFKTEKRELKFSYCEILADNLQKLSGENCSIIEQCLPDIMKGLEAILCSKITPNQRRPSLFLASEILSKLGVSRFVSLSSDSNFVVIVTRLACIEIGLFLRDSKEKKFDSFVCQEVWVLLTSCFRITEIFCAAIAQFEQNEEGTGPDILNFEQIRLAQPALADMANSLFDHITIVLGCGQGCTGNRSLLSHVCIRMLGSWLNVENNLTSAQGIEMLSIMPNMLHHAWSMKDLILLKTVLPAIMLAGDSSDTHNAIMDNGAFTALLEILKNMLESRSSFVNSSDDREALHLLLQTLVAICATNNFKSFVSTDGNFTALLSEMWSCFIDDQKVPVATEGYILSLATIIFYLYPESQQTHVKLFKKCLAFTFGAYKVSETGGQVVLRGRFEDCWQEISSLWQLSLYKMTHCCQEKFAKGVFEENGWSNVVKDLVETVKTPRAVSPELTSVLIDLSVLTESMNAMTLVTSTQT